jgi:hypothetical protein
MPDEVKGPSRDELAELANRPVISYMDDLGITLDYLLKRAKRALNAKETKNAKLKGAVKDLPRGRRLIATSGTVHYEERDGVKILMGGDGDSLIEWDEVAWSIREGARKDMHKLRGDYPADRMEHTGKDGGPIQTIPAIEREALKEIAKEVVKGLTGGK